MRLLLIALSVLLSAYVLTLEVKPDTLWLDVRTAEEYAAGHISGAVNIPHTEVAARIGELKLDKTRPIAIYCKSGRRAAIALEALQQLGYSDLSNLGGYEDIKQQLNDENERQ
jgi:phage shock protein E